MERRKGYTSNILKGFAILLMVVFLIPATGLGQQKEKQKKPYPNDRRARLLQLHKQTLKKFGVKVPTQSSNQPQSQGYGVNYSSVGQRYVTFDPDQSWNRNPNPNPKYNFRMYGQGQPAGDINGDGIDDYIVTGIARDERTAMLEDKTGKTAVYYGDSTLSPSTTPDQLIYDRLIPVGDINGDGYADAVREVPSYQYSSSSDNYAYIYKGTANGYQKTSKYLTSGFNQGNEQFGFIDLNHDGYDDVICYYSNYSSSAYIYWGAPLSDITSTPLYFSLTSDPKRIEVADIDQDSLLEIVEYSSYIGGQIKIFQEDTVRNSTPVQQSSTTFTSLPISSSHLPEFNLIDSDGDGYLDFYAYDNTVTPVSNSQYLARYDTTQTYSNIYPVNITLSGTPLRLYPIGDINDNGITDFVGNDSDSTSTKANLYIDALSGGNSLQWGSLAGHSSTDWYWDVEYNPYGSFGDLNGDGVDDALISHQEQNSGNRSMGRRILVGSTSNSYNSVFQLYDYNNYYSIVEETKNVGDVNGDGIDDFAVNYYDQNKTEVFFGDSTLSQTPSLVLNLGFSPMGITSGDFNGDGISDIAVSGFVNNYNGDSQLNIYYGGANMDANADFSLKASDFESVTYPDFYNIKNIGDVNADSTDDFFVGSSYASDSTSTGPKYLNQGYIFYGSSSISSSPDVTIQLSSDTSYVWAGESSAALGDVNGDGIDDFAVGNAGVRHADGTSGNVEVFYGGSGKSFNSPDKVLTPERTAYGFGYRIAAGDFNGDGANDIAVDVNNTGYSEMGNPPTLIYVYNGGPNFDINADHFLNIPTDVVGGTSGYQSEVQFAYSDMEVIPDFTNNGMDELLFTTAPWGGYTNAAIFAFINKESYPSAYLKAPNQDASLGGRLNVAIGDFNADGEIDAILPQLLDDNDANFSSRFYRYDLTTPLTLTSVEDVPDDQGGWVRVHAGGFLMDAMNQNAYGLDSWGVWRMTPDSTWTNVATVQPFSDGAHYVDVHVPKTQPTNVDTVDFSYTFKIVAFSNSKVVAATDPLSGKAYDNVAPGQVQGLAVQGQSSPKLKLKTVSRTLSWNTVDANDVSEYDIYPLNADGTIADTTVGSSTSTSFILPDAFEGVQNFVVKARDEHNNYGKASSPASAIYPKPIQYREKKGWNLVSFPMDASDFDVLTQMVKDSTSAPVYEYDGSYQQVTQLQAGKGYWMKLARDDNFDITRLPATKLTLNLKKGWNLVSGVGGDMPLSAISDPDGILIKGTAYEFDQAYTSSDTLRPGMGYWIRTSQAGTVTLTHPKLVTTKAKAKLKEKTSDTFAEKAKKVENTFDNVTISDGSHSTKLYFGNTLPQGISKLSYSLPPLPPGKAFDARFKGDSRLVEDAEMYIKLGNPTKDPLTLKVQVQSLAKYSKFTVKEFSNGQLLSQYTVDANKETELKHNDTDAIYVAPAGGPMAKSETPTEFKLQQNYPNPFNPTTQIKYSVAKTAPVKLEVFNILGKRVATLVNKQQKPGRYEVTFDGSHLASGMYLYRLKAGNHVMTKKLILAK